jgi:hypothetical protein
MSLKFSDGSTGQRLGYEDYLFRMILKQGHVVSRPNEPIYVEAHDLSELEGRRPVFKMTLAESSMLEETWPSFATSGLSGEWTLNGTTGLLKLFKAFEAKDSTELKLFLLDPQGHEIMRSRYQEMFADSR